jgi:hypothetical protein
MNRGPSDTAAGFDEWAVQVEVIAPAFNAWIVEAHETALQN